MGKYVLYISHTKEGAKVMTGVVVVPEDKSPFFDVFFRNLPYPLASGIVRAIKTGLSFILAGLAVAIADGTLLKGIGFIPAGYLPVLTVILGMLFTGLEKTLRENGLLNDVKDIEISPVSSGPPDDVVSPPVITNDIPINVDTATVQPAVIITPTDAPDPNAATEDHRPTDPPISTV